MPTLHGLVATRFVSQVQEIKNGRLAMWAASGLILQGCTTHQGGIQALMSSLEKNSF